MKGVTVTEEDFSVMNYDTVETVLYQIKVDMVKRCKAKCGWQNLKAVFIRSNKTWETRQTQVDSVNTGTSVT